MGKRKYSDSESSASEEDRKSHSKRHRQRKERRKIGENAQLSKKDHPSSKLPEFKEWLLEAKDKQLMRLTAKDETKYWHKFVKRWNKGKLADRYYDGLDEDEIGPSLPPPAEGTREYYERQEEEREQREKQEWIRSQSHKQSKREYKDEERDSRATGKDRLLEKKADARASHQAMASRKDEDMNFDDKFLMGEDSFQARLAARDQASSTRNNARARAQAERQAELNDKRSAYRAKEDATMAQFHALAAARFGNTPAG